MVVSHNRLAPTDSINSFSSESQQDHNLKNINRQFSTSRTSFSSMCSDKHEGIQHSAVNINDIMTWVSFILPDCKDHSDSVIVFIPGNPGAIEFYDSFILQLFNQCKIPIFGISYAGHNLIPSNSLLVKRVFKEVNPQMKNSDKHVYTLEEQISHKLSFIRQFIDPTKKIILIAHSLGSYIILQMLKKMENTDMIKQVILLFPVFERTMETTSGKFWVPMTQILQKPCTRLVEMLPPSVKKSLIDLIANQRKFSSSSKDSLATGVSSLVTPNGLRNMTQIARDLSKIGNIGELEGVIKKHETRLTFYYGANDMWTPLSFYREMKQKFPNIDIRLDGKGIGHAFVLQCSSIVAPIVAGIIHEKKINDDIETGSIHSYHDYIYKFSFKRSRSYKSGRKFSNPVKVNTKE